MAAKNCYFKQQIDKFGETFVSLITPDQIQGQAKRVVKELVKGEIEFEKYGQYFLDLKLLDNLIIGISNELDDYSLYSAAVSFYKQYYPMTPNITVRENHLQTLCYIYNIILTKLQYVRNTHDIGYLSDISALLYNYRNHLK